MQRREALRNLLIIGGGTVLVNSCASDGAKKIPVPLNHLKVSADQEELLLHITETLIPKTDTPGARELGVHQFVLVMVDDCAGKDDHKRFVSSLEEINGLAQKNYGSSFIKCRPEDRQQLLARIEKKEFGDALGKTLGEVKSLAIEGYLKSQYVMTNLLKYKLVPGRFYGSYPVAKKSTSN